MENFEVTENKIQELEELSEIEEKDTEDSMYDDLEETLKAINYFFDVCEKDDEEDSLDDEDEPSEDGEESSEDSDSYSFDDDEEEFSVQKFEESLAFFDDMVGMEHIKEKFLRLGRYVQWRDKMHDAGVDTSNFPQPNLTFMFLGDPGTGKTTVAKHMGEILHRLGLLWTEHVYEYRREDLVGVNYGSEELNTKDAINEAKGGVFFLDEAYQCFKQSTDKRDPGYHILETMMQHFGTPGSCFIMAGYKHEMQELFKVNPGFRSRIPDENIIEFSSPSEQMLLDVADNAFTKMNLHVAPDAHDLLQQHIHDMWTSKCQDFGNARVIRQLTESVVINHANRIMTSPDSDDLLIDGSDIKRSIPQQQKTTPTRSRIGFV